MNQVCRICPYRKRPVSRADDLSPCPVVNPTKACLSARNEYLRQGDGTTRIVLFIGRRAPLSAPSYALVDDDDVPMLSSRTWWLHTTHNSSRKRVLHYAARSGGKGRVKKFLMHRLLLGAMPDQLVDHINRDSLDNRRVNIRLCSHQENSWNRAPNKGSSSRFKGVFWSERYGKFAARISCGSPPVHLGWFESKEQAALAYDAAASVLHGDFAFFNLTTDRLLIMKAVSKVLEDQKELAARQIKRAEAHLDFINKVSQRLRSKVAPE